MMEKELSERIRIVGLVATFLVVLRHSLNMVAFFGSADLAPSWLREIEFVGSVMTESAIPVFFVVSGFFFSRTLLNNVRDYLCLLKKKSRTLLVPFLIWNLVGFIIVYASGRFAYSDSWTDYLVRLVASDYNGVLWYVRNLIFMMLLYPLYGWIFRVNSWYLYAPLLALLFWFWWPVDMTWYSSEGWLFFLLGGVIYHKLDVNKSVAAWVALVSLILWIACSWLVLGESVWLHKIVVLLGICSLWMVSSVTSSTARRWLLPLGAYSFLVYVLHQFVIKAMKVSLAECFYQNAQVAVICYFVLPVVTVLILLGIGYVWKRLSPNSYSVCMGGRV